MEKSLGYKDLFVEKNYLKSFIANIVNRFGDSIDALAFAWMVYEITGDRAWSAIIFGLNILPSILLLPLAGVFVEKYDKRCIMIIADIGRAVLVSIIATLYLMGIVRPWMLAASTLIMSSFEAFRIPASLSIFPKIVPREKFSLATSFNKACSAVAVIIGTSAFGLIVTNLGLQGAMYINTATFFISAFFIAIMNIPKEKTKEVKMTVKYFFKELKGGFDYFRTQKIVFLICCVGSLIGVLVVPFNSLLTPYVKENLGMGEYALSVLSITMLVGNIIGTLLFPVFNKKIGKSRLFIIGGVVIGISYLGYVGTAFVQSETTIYAAIAVTSFILGFGASFLNVVVSVAFMENIAQDYLGRVGALFDAMVQAFMPVASFFVAALVVYFNVVQVFMISGIIVISLFFVLSFNKLFKEIDINKTENIA